MIVNNSNKKEIKLLKEVSNKKCNKFFLILKEQIEDINNKK